MSLKLNKIIKINGKLNVLESGLRIGGTGEAAGIGEIDNPIIRHPIKKTPYIPGSSVKGKIRSLLELRLEKYSQRGGPCDCGKCDICLLFGSGNIRTSESPTRVIFRDSYPDETTQKRWDDHGIDSEEKTEVTIDRTRMTANPRQMERIPGDSSFDFTFSIRMFDGDDTKKLLGVLAEGFELLEKDYLGGSGSRGYGHVAIVEEDGKPMHEHLRTAAF